MADALQDHAKLIEVARRWERLYRDEVAKGRVLERELAGKQLELVRLKRGAVVERDTQIAALKAALQTIVDATEPCRDFDNAVYFAAEEIEVARDVAAGLLMEAQ